MAINRTAAVVGVCAAAAAAVVLVLTSRPPREAPAPRATASVGNVVSLTDADRQRIEGWRAEGFVRSIAEGSHEVFVDGTQWRALAKAEKEARVKQLSLYFKSLDGTRQILVKDADSGASLADFFADVLRITE
jgi:membrane protein implicated in regulation of membrane protease activity